MKESNFQLVGKPKINSLSYETNKEFSFVGELPLTFNNDVNITRGIDENSHEAIVVLDLGIFSTQEFEKVPFQINMKIEGHFKWADDLASNEELLGIMLKQNAPAVLYGYLRPLITLITVEASMPPLIIPLMNFKD